MDSQNNHNQVENKNIKSRVKAVWDAQTLNLFCELCVKEVEGGQRPGTHFTKVGWENLIKNFKINTGKTYDKVQLKNKWDSLKNDWKLWKQLIGKETGLGWKNQKRTIDASDEWWDKKLEVITKYLEFIYIL